MTAAFRYYVQKVPTIVAYVMPSMAKRIKVAEYMGLVATCVIRKETGVGSLILLFPVRITFSKILPKVS